MLQYLIIMLDDTSASFCHYDNKRTERKLIPLNILHEGIRFAMLENLMIQFVYPSYELPTEDKKEIETIDHSKIKPFDISIDDADVVVTDKWDFSFLDKLEEGVPVVLRTNKEQLFKNYADLYPLLEKRERLNIVLTDLESFTEEDFNTYKTVLEAIAVQLEKFYTDGKSPQLNILTDRMMLAQMNNCGAGESSITLTPNGKFYICPAFYFENEKDDVGDLQQGHCVKNQQLYKINHAPICRHCDAWQCKRCIWLNRKTTLEVNSPSHEQCVVAHLERNASKTLLENIRKHGTFLPDKEAIKDIDYLDPFDKRDEW